MFQEACRYRLTARTPGSHPGNRGSIPRSGADDVLSIKYQVSSIKYFLIFIICI